MVRFLLTSLLLCSIQNAIGQIDTTIHTKKERLDFARGYFELGGTYVSSFSGKQVSDNNVSTYENPATLNTTLYWGAFHFWGHSEFYVSFPLGQLSLGTNNENDVVFNYSAVTGARYYPWAVRNKKLRPYVGLSWSAFNLKQIDNSNAEDDQPTLQKNFSWAAELGLLYKYKKFAVRLGASYFPDNQWDYPVSKTQFENIESPNFGVNLGLLYTTDFTKNNGDPNINERWNEFPTVSSLGLNATNFGDFFLAIGPSLSFSLAASDYNLSELPYLSESYTSQTYFDMALGYQFNKLNSFAAVTFRNPTFKQEAYGTTQTIKKTSVTLEAAKFLTDYSGFAPFIGLNVAYDAIAYDEVTDVGIKNFKLTAMEPGISFGWDIVPGKTEEFLILRTNLRWYPFSSFEVAGKKFNFSQLEYNLIQAVFYPERLLKSRKKRKPRS